MSLYTQQSKNITKTWLLMSTLLIIFFILIFKNNEVYDLFNIKKLPDKNEKTFYFLRQIVIGNPDSIIRECKTKRGGYKYIISSIAPGGGTTVYDASGNSIGILYSNPPDLLKSKITSFRNNDIIKDLCVNIYEVKGVQGTRQSVIDTYNLLDINN